jgi:hypothetical protein
VRYKSRITTSACHSSRPPGSSAASFPVSPPRPKKSAGRAWLVTAGCEARGKPKGSRSAWEPQVITTITATVIQGRFQGRTAVEVIPLPQAGLLQCLTTGFTGATGVTTLTITWAPLGVNGG